MARVAFLFAGQGSQKPGMGKALYDSSTAAHDLFDKVEAVRPGTIHQCFEGTAEELKQTINTQPCVFTTDLACAYAVQERGIVPETVAGHSLGEIAADTFSGIFTLEEGVSFVMERARLMQQCSEEHPGAMRAVLKLNAQQVEELAREAGDEAWPVNYNSPQQTVVAGSAKACKKLDQLVKEAGGRSLPLRVSGAFHSPYMSEATTGLKAYLKDHAPHSPKIETYANYTGESYDTDPEVIAHTVANQVSHPVKWTGELHAIRDAGIDTFIEVGPGHTLTGLVKRTLKDVTTYNVETVEQLDQVVAVLRGDE